jgi:hypothetical protein
LDATAEVVDCNFHSNLMKSGWKAELEDN